MGKIRIKQIGEKLEDIEKPVDSVVAKLASPKRKKTKPTHPRQLHGRSKRYKKLQHITKSAKTDRNRTHTKSTPKKANAFYKVNGLALKEAVVLAKKTATAKFDETIELHLTVTRSNLSAKATLPHPTGKKQRILILTSSSTKFTLPTKLNSVVVHLGGPKEIAKIAKSGSLDFDQIWATPDIMPKVAQIAKILGPKGLMPNPKNETVVNSKDLTKKIKSQSDGAILLETEKKTGAIHTVLGKASFKPKHLEENLKAILNAVKPQDIKRAVLTSTMGPAIPLNIKSY